MLARLTSGDLRKQVDLSDVGMGSPDVTWVLNTFILSPTVMTCGEIAAKRPESGRTTAMPREIQEHEVAPRNGQSNGVHGTRPVQPMASHR